MITMLRAAGDSKLNSGEQLRLRHAVREFESMLIEDLLKLADEEKKPGSGGMEGYQDMRIQAVATTLAAGGGVGIGQILLRQLDRQEGSEY